MTHSIEPQDITGLILAGGRGSRMGGVDKGLQNFNGIPLALHTLMRLGPQVETVMVNANRNLSAYESFGASVWPDASADFAGPLSGFLVGLERAETPYVLTVPCDTPRLPLDLAERLAAAMVRENADIAMAAAPETDDQGQTQIRTQPVFCLMKIELSESLVKFTHAGGRKIDAWTAQHNTVVVAFDAPGDDPLAFANVNTLNELQALENAAP
ncbi:molybdenum cofactor guanylyltransferase MobA [Limnohabitans sp. Rim8]|jgi:molybdopterin-guanine dinucleotide biosynthesis protein A|uniref:Molybdenum cofactor guanylyltransferase n=1 Tax=Limnohabitans curvus TaxID=323423 RepID=A0A315ES99_9BURK|nr:MULTISPECIES: molybdenum cofactor guanylyltransferase MobA [Limnohabitans]PUE60633.1 molybdenum cofactor guanylyltransferase MobA [Limnohabitans curvus]PUE61387.1 molybdenum cofactor guanylyltransferase MobA [Limnohabitans sp. Rim8]